MRRTAGVVAILLAATAGAAGTAESLEAGSRILSRVARAIAAGSSEKLESIRLTYQMTTELGDESISGGRTVVYALPDRMSQVVPSPVGEAAVVLDGERGFMRNASGQLELPAEAVKAARATLGREMIVIAGNTDNPELEAVAVGTEEIDGKPCEIVAIDFLGGRSRLYVDGEGRVVRQTYAGRHPFDGSPGKIELRFSNHEIVGGRLLPRRQVMLFDGEEVATVTLESVEVNLELDPADFESR
jgi:hypothetical protein